MSAGRTDVTDGQDQIVAELALRAEVELLYLRVAVVRSDALERIKRRSLGQGGWSADDRKELADEQAWYIVARLGDVEHDIERRLAFLTNVGAGVALRVVEQAISRADHGFRGGLPGECEARSDGLVIGVDVGRGADAVLPGDE